MSVVLTEIGAACFERQVFTGSEHNKNKSSEHERACQREAGDQSANNEISSPTVCLLVCGYRLVSPLAPPWARVSLEQ